MDLKQNEMYSCWLSHNTIKKSKYKNYLKAIVFEAYGEIMNSALSELRRALEQAYDKKESQKLYKNEFNVAQRQYIKLEIKDDKRLKKDGYEIRYKVIGKKECINVCGRTESGILYGVFDLLRKFEQNINLKDESFLENPSNDLRLINQWDNIDGTVERGFAGSSILFESCRNKDKMKAVMEILGIPGSHELIREAFNDEYKISDDLGRINDYARMLSSIGINGIVINNTNVHKAETYLIDKKIEIVKIINEIMNAWGIRVYLSINFAAPITLEELKTADPLDESVINWWEDRVKYVYSEVKNLGGFMVKADSEGRPGPFTYGRNHADGANMLAKALKPYGGKLIWRCFVYNCRQDWRDYETDRARSAYDCFDPLDGEFLDNVYLQIKNGPMDFQVREPITPLFGAMDKTNKIMELQITQEYTGQQRDVCFLVPWWKEVLNTSTYANDSESPVKDRICGIAGIANIGNDVNWTGNYLAQANLYGYGRLIWNENLTTQNIIDEWITLSLGNNKKVHENISYILNNSWKAYEYYTSPLGIGWMVTPGTHYGPDIDGYEYSPWGTYNRADCKGLGVDRTIKTGTKYIEQYNEPLRSMYEDLQKCPEELLLFFHHVPYLHELKSGKTVIQHIYDTHFEGYDLVVEFIKRFKTLKENIPLSIYENVNERFDMQLSNAREWRDRVNTYFYRMCGINDENNRKIY